MVKSCEIFKMKSERIKVFCCVVETKQESFDIENIFVKNLDTIVKEKWISIYSVLIVRIKKIVVQFDS